MSKINFKEIGNSIEEGLSKVNWKVVGTVLTVLGGGIAIVAGFAKDRNQENIIRETARATAVDELKKMLSEANNHHNDG